MPRLLRIYLLLGIGTLLAGMIFYGIYSGDQNIEKASTGFNASSKGAFGWDYSFREYAFELDGEEYHAVLIDSGREIRTGRLVAEIVLCLGLGWGATFSVWAIGLVLGTTPGKQVGAGQPVKCSESIDIHDQNP